MSLCDCDVTFPGPSSASLGTCPGTMFVLFMGMMETHLKARCDILDPCHAIPHTAEPDEEYDFIVVGGGSAGSVVGSRLSEVREWKVLVVEAGSNEPLGSQVPSLAYNYLGSPIDWKYYTEPEERACRAYPERRCPYPRGKVIGGTSVLFGMMYVRGSRKDYDRWEEQGNPGWSYKSVLPYFMKSEDNLQMDQVDKGYHGTGGLLPVTQFPNLPAFGAAIIEGAKELGQRVGDVNGEHHTGFTVIQTTSKDGVRHSAARSFLRPAMVRPNLHVMLRTTVTRVLVDPATKTAYGVEIIKPDGTRMLVRAKKEVIISGGTINSPHILLLSGVGPKEDLAKVNVPLIHDLPGVGKNLQNHACTFLNFELNETDDSAITNEDIHEYLTKKNGPMSSTGLTQVTGLFNSRFANPADDDPDLQMLFLGGFIADRPKHGCVKARHNRVIQFLPDLLRPKSRGYITLRDNNPLSPPKIFARIFSDKEDFARLLDGVKFALKLSQTEALQRYGLTLVTAKGCEDEVFGSDAYWECTVYAQGIENHQVGTCKMGPSSDPLSVVSYNLKVHGLARLRVVDASVMPDIISGNPYSTIIMIAEKASDMIKEAWLDTLT